MDYARALVFMEELTRCIEVQPIVLPNFDKDTYPRACVIEGDEVLILRMEEHGEAEVVCGHVKDLG